MGHLVPLSLLAKEMVRSGHRVTFIASDIAHAARFLDFPGIQWLSAPRLKNTRHLPALNNHADILLTTGYDSSDHLHALLGAWRSLFTLLKPDRIVCEYAPTAQLAANTLRIPVVCIDNGFSIPPVSEPMPALRDDQNIPKHLLVASEHEVLGNINGALERLGCRTLPRFSCLYEDETWYRNWPEFNHFGPHSRDRHLGQIFGDTGGISPAWPRGKGQKLFAYIKNDYPFVSQLLQSAASMGFRVLAYLPGQPASLVKELMDSQRIIVCNAPVRLSALEEDVEIGIWQSPTGGVGHSLEKGMRMLFLPTQAEQYRACRAVEKSGISALVAIGPQDWHSVLGSLIKKPRMKLNGRWQQANIASMSKILGGY